MYPDSWKTSFNGPVNEREEYSDEESTNLPILPAKQEVQQVNKLLNRFKTDTWDRNMSFIKDARKHGIGICVIGPPFSGKTTLAQHLAMLYGLQYVSESSVLESMEEPSTIVDDLRNGKSISKELIRQLLVKNLAALSMGTSLMTSKHET